MESNDQLMNTNEVGNHPEQSEQSTTTTEINTEIITEIKKEIIPVEVNIYYYVV